MSQSAHHVRIGIFVLAGIFLAAGTAIYVGSMRLFANEVTVLLYFGESVNGLSIGSPVKFKGVPVGEVSDIRIAYNQDREAESSFIPVFAKIDLDRVYRDLGVDPTLDFSDDDVFDAQILEGLRGKLEMQSFITGQLYVELDYFAHPYDRFQILQKELRYKEIPTVPSTMAEFGSSASNILAKLAALDVKGINEALKATLETLETKLAALETERWNASVLELSGSLRKAADGLDLEPLLAELTETNKGLQTLISRVDGALDPALDGYHRLVSDARETLEGVDQTFVQINGLLRANTGVGQQIEPTLLEIRDAARSLRELLDYIERNPRAFLTGREMP